MSRPPPERANSSIQAQSKYDAVVEADRLKARSSKLMRMSDRNFIAVGKTSRRYVAGINAGDEFKDPWEIKFGRMSKSLPSAKPFYTSVARNRAFDS